METKLQHIREKCIEANPSIKDLVFGCKVVHESSDDMIYTVISSFKPTMQVQQYEIHREREQAEIITQFYMDNHMSIIGREIRLADVLLAIPKRDLIVEVSAYFFYFGYKGKGLNRNGGLVDWNLKQDNLELQSEECIEFIYNLLK